MSDENKIIKCGTHGQAGIAFACSHLIQGRERPLGFFYTETDEENQEPQAWCGECEALLAGAGDWTDELLERANIRVVCEFCFESLRKFHASPT
jgi:hypothetical protein